MRTKDKTVSELLKHLSSVHVAAGTAIDDDYLFPFLS